MTFGPDNEVTSPDKPVYRHSLSELLFEAAHLVDEGELKSVDELVEWVKHHDSMSDEVLLACPICHQPWKVCDDCAPRPDGDD